MDRSPPVKSYPNTAVYVPDILDPVPTSFIFLTIPAIYHRQWTASACLPDSEKVPMTHRWKHFLHFRVREWSTAVSRGAILSLTWICLLPLSAAVGEMVLLAAGLGVLCALTSLFASLAYVRRQHLFERVVKDEGAVTLPLNIWIFLSLPSLYFGYSLLLLGLVLLWGLCVQPHQPLSWGLPAPEIPLYIMGLGIPLLLAPYRLVVQNFQLLTRGMEPMVAVGIPGRQTISSN